MDAAMTDTAPEIRGGFPEVKPVDAPPELGRFVAAMRRLQVAVVALADDARADTGELTEHAAKTLARYKLPKVIIFRAVIERSPCGKADYRRAREQAANEE
jgi:acyl-CoA synthetase (AMP-forming)/AMP-acid ligase II